MVECRELLGPKAGGQICPGEEDAENSRGRILEAKKPRGRRRKSNGLDEKGRGEKSQSIGGNGERAAGGKRGSSRKRGEHRRGEESWPRARLR